MKLKRLLSALTSVTIALTTNCLTAVASLEDNGIPYNQEPTNGDTAETKPVMTVSKIILNSLVQTVILIINILQLVSLYIGTQNLGLFRIKMLIVLL